MQLLKSLLYYLTWTVYYVLCFCINSLVRLALINADLISILVICLALVSIASPFIIAPAIMGKLYIGQNKRTHLLRWIDALKAGLIVFLIGSIANMYFRGLDQNTFINFPFFIFNISLIISLYRISYKMILNPDI